MSRKKIYAVIGDPIAHSLSPVMHNAAFRALDMDCEYIAVHVKAEELPAFAEASGRIQHHRASQERDHSVSG